MTYRVLIDHATKPVPQRRQDHGKSLRILSSQPTLSKRVVECDDWTDLMRPSPKAEPKPWSPALTMNRLGLEQIAWPSGQSGHRHGFIYGRQVAIRPNAPFPLNTLFHELGHFVLGHFVLGHFVLGHFVLGHFVLGHFVLGHSFETSRPEDSRPVQEVMAETVAFSMMAMVGAVTYDSLSVSWFYLANWA